MTASDAHAFFASRAFRDWQKRQDAALQLQVAQIERLNGLIRAIGVLIKSGR